MKTNRYSIEIKTPSGWLCLSEVEPSLKPFYYDLVEAVKMFDLYVDLAIDEGQTGTVRLVRIARKPDVLLTAAIL